MVLAEKPKKSKRVGNIAMLHFLVGIPKKPGVGAQAIVANIDVYYIRL